MRHLEQVEFEVTLIISRFVIIFIFYPDAEYYDIFSKVILWHKNLNFHVKLDDLFRSSLLRP